MRSRYAPRCGSEGGLYGPDRLGATHESPLCLVADAGMISKKQIAAVEARGWLFILGARLRRTKEVRDVVLSDTGAFDTVEVERQRPDPMTLQVKEVTVEDTPGKGCRCLINVGREGAT